jgi:hypothetical protein
MVGNRSIAETLSYTVDPDTGGIAVVRDLIGADYHFRQQLDN